MARRSDRTKCRIAATRAQRLDGGEPGAGSKAGSLEASRAGVGVGVETASTLGAHGLHPVEIPGGVYTLEVDPFGGLRLEHHDGIGHVGTTNTFEHGVEALGALGMARPGQMFEVCRMGGEQHGHVARRYLPRDGPGLPFDP